MELCLIEDFHGNLQENTKERQLYDFDLQLKQIDAAIATFIPKDHSLEQLCLVL